jgi:demethylmenaquinone methyltransferase/2-methoxy-6-polyprenyl-1,4-benzoquinol methylase
MLVKKVNLKTGDNVLDICCGIGLNFPFILEKIGKQGTLRSLDVSSKMLKHSKKRLLNGNWCFIRSDSAHLPLCNKSQDIILASFCLRIMPALDVDLDETVRVLKSDGSFGKL